MCGERWNQTGQLPQRVHGGQQHCAVGQLEEHGQLIDGVHSADVATVRDYLEERYAGLVGEQLLEVRIGAGECAGNAALQFFAVGTFELDVALRAEGLEEHYNLKIKLDKEL